MAIIINARVGENLEQMIKRYKKEFKQRKQVKEVRERKFFKRRSLKRRVEVQQAIYRERYVANMPESSL